MRKITIFTLVALLYFINNVFGQDTNKVEYRLFMEQSLQFGTFDTRIDSGAFYEGGSFIIPEATLPSSPIDFSNYQDLYNALVGGKFHIDFGALNKDIVLKIYIRNLDPNSNTYLPKGSDGDTLFAYFEMRIWELPDSNFIPEDSNYYFNDGFKARLCIPKTSAFDNFLDIIGISQDDTLAFAYFGKSDWTEDGITTINTPDSVCFEGIHLSKIGGGRGNIYVTGIEVEKLDGIPTGYQLNQNYPNPFNPTTKIKYSIPSSGDVSLTIYDILGNKVSNIVSGYQNRGTYEVSFNAENLASGIYFYRLKTKGFTSTKKMILSK